MLYAQSPNRRNNLLANHKKKQFRKVLKNQNKQKKQSIKIKKKTKKKKIKKMAHKKRIQKK
jgi:hypothetical protein